MGLCVLMYTKNITTQKLAACLILWEKTPTPLSPQGVKGAYTNSGGLYTGRNLR